MTSADGREFSSITPGLFVRRWHIVTLTGVSVGALILSVWLAVAIDTASKAARLSDMWNSSQQPPPAEISAIAELSSALTRCENNPDAACPNANEQREVLEAGITAYEGRLTALETAVSDISSQLMLSATLGSIHSEVISAWRIERTLVQAALKDLRAGELPRLRASQLRKLNDIASRVSSRLDQFRSRCPWYCL